MKHWFGRMSGAALLALHIGAPPLVAQDTLLIRATAPAVWGDSVPLQLEVRIGSLEGSGADAFGRVASVAATMSGEVVVVDSRARAVRVFAVDGRYLRDLGRVGQGPGEYLQPLAAKVTPDGRVAVWDPGNQRLSVYGLDGAFVESFQLPSGFFTSDPLQVDTAGCLYVKSMAAGERGGLGKVAHELWIRVSSSGVILDSIPIPYPGDTHAFSLGSPAGRRRPFPVETVSTLSPMGFQVSGQTDRYRLTRVLRDGRAVAIERDPGPPVQVGREERAQWEAARAHMAQATDLALAPIPKQKPVFREVWADQQGRLWVSRYVKAGRVRVVSEARKGGSPPVEWQEPATWDVLDDRGRFLGSLAAPSPGELVAALDDWVWLLELGQFGEQYLTRYRIERAPAVGG